VAEIIPEHSAVEDGHIRDDSRREDPQRPEIVVTWRLGLYPFALFHSVEIRRKSGSGPAKAGHYVL
jgi:hypothetical protein